MPFWGHGQIGSVRARRLLSLKKLETSGAGWPLHGNTQRRCNSPEASSTTHASLVLYGYGSGRNSTRPLWSGPRKNPPP